MDQNKLDGDIDDAIWLCKQYQLQQT
jgi:hypothetical protein